MNHLKKGSAALVLLCALVPLCQGFDLNDLDVSKAVSGVSKAVSAARGVSDKEEIAVGKEVAANLAARYGTLEDPALIKYLNLIGQALVPYCGRTGLSYHFAVLNTKQINAFAAPGGYIFITRGILETAKDEGQLAGVIAHEIAHVAHRHIAKEIRKANVIGAGVDLTEATSKSGHEAMDQVTQFSTDLLFKGLSRDDEREADLSGTKNLSDAGYQPGALKSFLAILTRKNPDDKSLTVLNKTHPRPEDRIQSIDAYLNASGLSRTGVLNADRFESHTKAFHKAVPQS